MWGAPSQPTLTDAMPLSPSLVRLNRVRNSNRPRFLRGAAQVLGFN